MSDQSEASRAARAFNARLDVVAALENLPYRHAASSRVPMPVANYEQDGTAFLEAITPWIESLGKSLTLIYQTSVEMQTELTTLREQRQAVREFFGTVPLPDPFGSRTPGER